MRPARGAFERRLLASLAAGAVAAAPVVGIAQAYQCAPPARLAGWPAPAQEGPAVRAPIAGYTVAVSWAPEFCHGVHDRGSLECSGQIGRFG